MSFYDTIIGNSHGNNEDIRDGTIAQGVHNNWQQTGSTARCLPTPRACPLQEDLEGLLLTKELLDVLENIDMETTTLIVRTGVTSRLDNGVMKQKLYVQWGKATRRY